MKKDRLIIWDWNGTLLDDIRVSIDSMNSMLKKRQMPEMNPERYRDIFTFPVIDYYKKLGYDFRKEPFEKLADEFISLYRENSKKAWLQKGAVSVLRHFNGLKFKQIILSAMEQNSLEKQIGERGVLKYFGDIVGLDNIQADGKLEIAKKYYRKNPSDSCILIGDTYHDFEVAEALKCRCLLVNNGHQNLKRFNFNGKVEIFSDLDEIKKEMNHVWERK